MRFPPLFIVSSLLILLSCDPGMVYEKNIKIPDGIWEKDHKVSFEVFINDTISAHNLYVNVRNTSLYPFSNLYLFIKTTAPSGHTIQETFEITLCDEKGKWLGSGLGDIWDLQQVYKKNVRFAQRGKYTIEYQQGMRMDRLPFVLDVGLRIEVEK
jgi:gliding motility-associated lipoprotein GldH